MKMTTPIPQLIATPQSVDTRTGELNFFDGYRVVREPDGLAFPVPHSERGTRYLTCLLTLASASSLASTQITTTREEVRAIAKEDPVTFTRSY